MSKENENLNEAKNSVLNIADVISRFSDVNKERNELNKQIREHYTPLLTEACKTKNKAEYDRLLNELPDCPFVLTAYRIGELHGL